MGEEGKEVYAHGGEENAIGGKGRSSEQEGEDMMRRVEGCDMLAVQEKRPFPPAAAGSRGRSEEGRGG